MNSEQLVERKLAGETKALEENLLPVPLCSLKSESVVWEARKDSLPFLAATTQHLTQHNLQSVFFY
jgi:hypothetical protein